MASGAPTPRRLLLASSSPHKLREMEALLEGLPYRVLTPATLAASLPEVDETGATFKENACLKALAAARAVAAAGERDMLTLADDSGLMVHALNGVPGIRSARFAGLPHGAGAADRANTAVLLSRLEGIPDARRSACFCCSLAVALDDEILLTVSGSVSGRILRSCQGKEGFGYDPVFFHLPSGKTFAEMSGAEKMKVSHRGRAMRRLHRALATLNLRP